MKLALAFIAIFIVGAFAGAPSHSTYYHTPTSPSSSSSSNALCDLVRFIVAKLSKIAYLILKEYCRQHMIVGRSDELTTESKARILNQVMGDFNADKHVSDDDKNMFDTLLNLPNFGGSDEWGFDADAIWDCLLEIFPDLWD